MRRTLILTAYDRPDYLREALSSWLRVRGKNRWDIVFRIEPGPIQETIRTQIETWCGVNAIQADVFVNPVRYGVLHHPWVAFEEAFMDTYVDFVVRAEDDLLVSSDILEYFEWASEEFARAPDVGAVIGWNMAPNTDPGAVALAEDFNSWTWGTWRWAWEGVMRDSWDHDYSTYNDAPGHQSGWDWNLGTRIFPSLAMKSVFPALSRVQNIGAHGVHGTPENLRQSSTFELLRPPTTYHLDGGSIVQT